jgi:cytidine deaminase
MGSETPTSLPDDVAMDLMQRARAAAPRAYSPYSRFPVGAAAITASGEVFEGVNVENASSGLTTCAERVAIQAAIAAGHQEIRAVAVTAPRAPGTTPCGACRQVMNEFKPVNREMFVILDYVEHIAVIPLSELLPRAFGPRDLERAT